MTPAPNVIAELIRVKALFQQRAIIAALGLPHTAAIPPAASRGPAGVSTGAGGDHGSACE